MDEKETMTLVKTLTEKIINLQSDLRYAKEMKDYYYDKSQMLEAEVKEISSMYVNKEPKDGKED